MTIPFEKYQGAGNDFIMIDQRTHQHIKHNDQAQIALLCDRRFGIGADGLILLENEQGYDFKMVYFNSDGQPSSMCGNGGRCIVAYAKALGLINSKCKFLAVDGPHDALVRSDGLVELQMQDVTAIEMGPDYFYLNTGSPHFIRFAEDAHLVDVVHEGQKVRYNDRFRAEGTNVNFVSLTEEGGLAIATYERGVEDETLACGTGVTAAAIADYLQRTQKPNSGIWEIPVKAKGGQLWVRFQPEPNAFKDIWLISPAKAVYKGEISV